MDVTKADLDASVRYLSNDLGTQGIRVNFISAEPIRTLSAKAISEFNSILKEIEKKISLRGNVTQEEVDDTPLFLISDLSREIMGENIQVNAGYHVLG